MHSYVEQYFLLKHLVRKRCTAQSSAGDDRKRKESLSPCAINSCGTVFVSRQCQRINFIQIKFYCLFWEITLNAISVSVIKNSVP